VRLQELAQWTSRKRPGKDVIYAAFERVPPQFRRTGRSQKNNWNRLPPAPHSFDEVPPIAISQGELRDDHGLLARRVEQAICGRDAGCPLHNQSGRFDVLCDRGFRAPGGNENYCSCSSESIHRFSKAAGFHAMPFGLRLAVSCRKLAVILPNFEAR
jgi:hypothetical protein